MKVAYFDCYSGISGDMILGALIDLGVELKTIQDKLKGLELHGYNLKSRRVKRGLISGTKVKVNISKNFHDHHASYTHIKKLIENSDLSQFVKERSLQIFKKIALAEAEIHGTTISKVHFHEVGAIDSIVDIVGGMVALELLKIETIFSSPLNTGEGSVACEHGVLPVPAPATLELLKGIPCYSLGIQKELTTPTGAAIITTVAKDFLPLPMMKVLASGYGAGDHIIDEIPNMLRIVLGEMARSKPQSRMIMIETNIDDMNPEFYEYAMDSLFEAGAVDVFFTPITMKKNRPAVKLSVLIEKEKQGAASRILLSETSTFGTRSYEVFRDILDRELIPLKTPFGKVSLKVGKLNGEVIQLGPEYEDCRRIAKRRKLPLKKVYEEVMRFALENNIP